MKYYIKGFEIIASDEAPSGFVEITEEQYNQYMGYHREITSLKYELKKTDYKALKHADGCYTEEEYAPTKELRQSLRNQINELLNKF